MRLRRYKKRSIKKGMVVLMRIDANAKDFSKDSIYRIDVLLEELRMLTKRGAKIVLMTHIGRPNGRHVKKLSTKSLAGYFKKKDFDAQWINEVKGKERNDFIQNKMKPGSLLILENLRFYKGEELNNVFFAKALADSCDIYINNAFGVSHRKHASISAITKYLPSYAGFRLCREVKVLSKRFRQPLALIMGGIKLETKVPTIKKLAPKAKMILTCGGIGTTFLSASLKKKLMAGTQVIHPTSLKYASQLLENYEEKIYLPEDVKILKKSQTIKMAVGELSDNDKVFDIGEKTLANYKHLLKGMKTIIWNGPTGDIRERRFQDATKNLGIILNKHKAKVIIGGGDTVHFLSENDLLNGIDFISTGGGAMLHFLGGLPMPGLEVLKKSYGKI